MRSAHKTLLGEHEVQDSNVGREIDFSYPKFLVLSRQIPGQSLKLNHDQFLYHRFHFIMNYILTPLV
jgi:hypothetical protein